MEIAVMLLGIVVMFMTNVGKRFGVDQKTTTLILAVTIGVGYALFTKLFGAEQQEEIVVFIMAILGTAKIIYDLATLILEKK